MTPSERRNELVRLLAEIDQKIVECEELARQPVPAYDEAELITAHLQVRRDARERVEMLLDNFKEN